MDPYTKTLDHLRELALQINPKVDITKIDLRYGPKPYDMSSNIALVLAASFKDDK